jgi:pimeloyl-ACP methyl ester carboxylesterase
MKKQFIELSEYTAAYTSIGTGIPVILLHGFFGDSWTLEPIASELAKDYCCISLEMLGFGDSSKPDIRYLVADHVAFLQEFLIAKDISEFHLIGYSFGAWVAAAYAIMIADRQILAPKLAEIVLLAPAGIRDDSFTGRYDHLKPLLWQTPLVDLAINTITPFAKLLGKNDFIKTVSQARQALVTQPAARSFLIDRLDPQAAIDTVEKDLDRITISTLVIAGEIDKTIPFWHSQAYADKVPQASLAVIPGADHDLVQTHDREVVQAITDYWHRS